MVDYERYFLSGNPFPETAVIDPFSDDNRVNGSIFQASLFRDEIENLDLKTQRKINMTYLSGIQFVKGVGKSALLIHHWRKCRELPESSSIYLRCDEKDKPKDLCINIIDAWHRDGTLWQVFKTILLEYSETNKDPLLAPDAVKFLLDAHPDLPNHLPLNLYTQVRNEESLARSLTSYTLKKHRVNEKNLTLFFKSYLTEPVGYPTIFNSTKVDPIEVFGDFVSLLSAIGYERHYIFLDQFEEMIMGAEKRGIGRLCLGLKKMILSSKRSVCFFVTLHPSSDMYLKIQEATDLTGIAPLDTIHRVDVMVLDTRGDAALTLAEEYFKHFRTREAPYTSYPVEQELVELICFLQQGNIRGFLQQMHNCIEYGLMLELPEISLSFALDNPLDIFGREISTTLLDKFNDRKNE